MKKIVSLLVFAVFAAMSLYAGDKQSVTNSVKTTHIQAQQCATGGMKATIIPTALS